MQSNEGNIYKNRKDKSLLGLYSSEDITNLNHHDIPERNIKCEICTRQLWNDIFKNVHLFKELHILMKALEN